MLVLTSRKITWQKIKKPIFDGTIFTLGAVQVLRNAVGGVSIFPEKKRYEGVQFNVISVTRGGWGPNSQEKSIT